MAGRAAQAKASPASGLRRTDGPSKGATRPARYQKTLQLSFWLPKGTMRYRLTNKEPVEFHEDRRPPSAVHGLRTVDDHGYEQALLSSMAG